MWLSCCSLLQTLFQARVAIRARNSITLFADGDYNLNLSECTTTPASSTAATAALLSTAATPYVPVPATVPFTVASSASGNGSAGGARIIGDVLFAPRCDPGAAADNNNQATKAHSTLHHLKQPNASLQSRSLQWNSKTAGALCAAVLLAVVACGLLLRSARRKREAAAAQQQREECSEQVETPTAAHRRSIGWVWGKGDDDDDT
jgi:uncharacterized protein (DUF2062 family)